jgi:mRNA-degrading endonuclease RelE of RelBE toxin-antitoxin system
MPYTARFSKGFLKKEKQLPSAVKLRIVKILKETLMKPDSDIMLVGPLKGLWKVRVGKYRIIYEIDVQEKRARKCPFNPSFDESVFRIKKLIIPITQ